MGLFNVSILFETPPNSFKIASSSAPYLLSANFKKIKPSTGVEYSFGLSLYLHVDYRQLTKVDLLTVLTH